MPYKDEPAQIKTKRRTRRKILKENPDQFPDALINSLPQGITYIGAGESTQHTKSLTLHGDSNIDDEDEDDIVRIGSFLVNVGVVTKDALKSMRTYWPMEDYRLLKNRKSARICRQRRKSERINHRSEVVDLKKDNDDLRARVRQLESILFGKPITHPTFSEL